MFEGKGIHHRNQEQDQENLDKNVETDPKSTNSSWSSGAL